ncbi:hypothetical protein CCACVL1_18174 [Corchorus capsularis]|uniref:Uncharacterized protein n=1 Tax=Corchorus capsularis TaxID=210143 RepID=A0A1R3HME9_COCAP|nr:hypothetical protein CCACVL1_18174 [Corchorus capsularis]
MPHRIPSPPDREAMEGTKLNVGAEEVCLVLSQQMISCFPPASMAQKKPLSPKAAAIGPNDP